MSVRICVGSLTRPMPQYAEAAGEGISILEIDPTQGEAGQRQVEGQFHDLIWTLASADGAMVFATHEVPGGDQSQVAAFRRDAATGRFTYLGSQKTGGCEACHASLSLDGRYLLVANYNGEGFEGLADQSIAVLPVGKDGLGAPVTLLRLTGQGPNRERQTRAHAHCVMPRPGTDRVHVADLATDRVLAYRLAPDGALEALPAQDIAFSPGDGPRHVVFSRDGSRIFTICELQPKITCHAFDGANGLPRLIGNFDIAPQDGVVPQPAGIVLAPAEAILYASLRATHEILGLRIAPEGGLTQAFRLPCGGRTPRDLTLLPGGRQLLVANQDSSRLTLFDLAAGLPQSPPRHIPVGTPMTATLIPDATQAATAGKTP